MSSWRIRKAGIPQMCDKVASSSPKGRGKGAMEKGGDFLPPKTQKALENQGYQRNSLYNHADRRG